MQHPHRFDSCTSLQQPNAIGSGGRFSAGAGVANGPRLQDDYVYWSTSTNKGVGIFNLTLGHQTTTADRRNGTAWIAAIIQTIYGNNGPLSVHALRNANVHRHDPRSHTHRGARTLTEEHADVRKYMPSNDILEPSSVEALQYIGRQY